MSKTLSEVIVPAEFHFLKPIFDSSLIRVGSDFDGGYVVSHKLFSRTTKLISIGYGWNSKFEKSVLRKYSSIEIQLFDDEANLLSCLNPWYKFPRFFFGSLAHGKIVWLKDFYWYQSTLDFLRLYFQNWSRLKYRNFRIVSNPNKKKEIGINQIILKQKLVENIYLKIDIEGSEYDIIEEIVQAKHNILGITIEFHDVSLRKQEFILAVKRLQSKFHINHIHPNNHRSVIDNFPDVIEISFISKNEIEMSPTFRAHAYLDVDSPNNPSKTDYDLIFFDNVSDIRPGAK